MLAADIAARAPVARTRPRPRGSEHPWAGLLFVDFITGDVIQITGRARLVHGNDLVARIEVEEVRETPGEMSLRFEPVEPAPVNS